MFKWLKNLFTKKVEETSVVKSTIQNNLDAKIRRRADRFKTENKKYAKHIRKVNRQAGYQVTAPIDTGPSVWQYLFFWQMMNNNHHVDYGSSFSNNSSSYDNSPTVTYNDSSSSFDSGSSGSWDSGSSSSFDSGSSFSGGDSGSSF